MTKKISDTELLSATKKLLDELLPRWIVEEQETEKEISFLRQHKFEFETYIKVSIRDIAQKRRFELEELFNLR